MSVRMITRVWDARGIPSSGVRLVLLKLADCANDNGEQSFPSVRTIADECELSPRQVQRALRWLVTAGFIREVTPASHHRPTEWALCLDVQGCHPVTPEAPPQGCHARRAGVTSMTRRGDISGTDDYVPGSVNDPSGSVPAFGDHLRRRLDQSETVLAVKVPAASDGFEDFWQAYPRKVGKQAALRVWQHLKLAQDRPLRLRILSAIGQQRQSEQWMKDGGQFIPHPQTWLRQGRWDDEPVQVPQMNDTTTKTLSAGARWLARRGVGGES